MPKVFSPKDTRGEDRRPAGKAHHMEGWAGKARQSKAITSAIVDIVTAGGGSGFVPDHLTRARQVMCQQHPDLFCSPSDVVTYINSSQSDPAICSQYASLVKEYAPQ